jgi:glycosyltransferase involved in cell wall biosynthesis
MDKIKVLHLARPMDGGMRKHVLDLMDGLNPHLFSLYLIAPRSNYQANSTKQYTFHPMEITDKIGLRQDYQIIRALSKYLKNEGIEILHTHGVKAAFLGQIAAFLAGTPRVIHTFHNLIYDRPYPFWKKWIYIWANRFLHLRADGIIAVSFALKKQLIKVEKIPESKIKVIYNGLSPHRFMPLVDVKRKKKSLQLEDGKPVIGVVARLVPEKGVDLFLDCIDLIAKQRKGTQFLIIGDGPQRPLLEQKCRQLNLGQKLQMLGFRRDVAEILPILNVVVIPSRSEGLSITALEAMACRRPIVAFAAGALPELIHPCKTGILVPQNQIQELAQAVLFLLDNPKIAERLGKNACEFVQAHFSLEKMIRETELNYLEILKGKTKKEQEIRFDLVTD